MRRISGTHAGDRGHRLAALAPRVDHHVGGRLPPVPESPITTPTLVGAPAVQLPEHARGGNEEHVVAAPTRLVPEGVGQMGLPDAGGHGDRMTIISTQ